MRSLALLLLALLAVQPARAQSDTVLTALGVMPADAAWWDKSRIVDIVDLAALKRASGVAEGVSFADFAAHKLGDADERAVSTLLWRFYAGVGFREYLLLAGEAWPARLGFEFLDLAWVSEIGNPPRRLLYLGGEAVPRGEGLAVLQGSRMAPVEHGGTTVWVRGEKDYGIDVQNRDVEFPFWGWLGSSARVYRGEAALVGARAWSDLNLALAVERGEAESLADLPRFRLAAEVAAAPDYSAGPVLQITFVDDPLGSGAIEAPPSPEGIPRFELLAFADREDATGHQLVLVLTFGSDAATAAHAADALAARLDGFRERGGKGLAERFPGLAVETSSVATADGAAAVAVLSVPPMPPAVDSKVDRSALYGYVLRLLYSRDLGFLAPRG